MTRLLIQLVGIAKSRTMSIRNLSKWIKSNYPKHSGLNSRLGLFSVWLVFPSGVMVGLSAVVQYTLLRARGRGCRDDSGRLSVLWMLLSLVNEALVVCLGPLRFFAF